MKKLLTIFFLFPLLVFAQGKFYGGDGPPSYAGATLVIQSLPVEYSFIRANRVESTIQIQWATYTEVENDYFLVEKMTGEEFRSLQKIKGAGTSSSLQHYEYIDHSPYNGINTYRMSQVDFDGQLHVSNLLHVEYEGKGISLYPNPAENELHIDGSTGQTSLALFNAAGREQPLIMLDSARIDISQLQSGWYYLQILLPTSQTSHQFLKN